MKNRLRELRAERGWSQAELADRLEVSRQSVNAIETGSVARQLKERRIMICKSTAARRYYVRFAVTMTLYVITLCVTVEAFVHWHPRGPLAYLLAVLPAIPCIALLAVFGLYLAEEKDEFQRMLGVQSMLWGIGGTLSVTTAWGFLQSFTHIPHFQPIWTFVLFWCFVGISTPLLQRKYR